MGYHADTCAAIIMQLFEDKKCPYDDFEQSICQEVCQIFSTKFFSEFQNEKPVIYLRVYGEQASRLAEL